MSRKTVIRDILPVGFMRSSADGPSPRPSSRKAELSSDSKPIRWSRRSWWGASPSHLRVP